jgi:hypothetical protein
VDELKRLETTFYKKFGRPARIQARQSIGDYKAELRKALETGDPGHLIPPEYSADFNGPSPIRD